MGTGIPETMRRDRQLLKNLHRPCLVSVESCHDGEMAGRGERWLKVPDLGGYLSKHAHQLTAESCSGSVFLGDSTHYGPP